MPGQQTLPQGRQAPHEAPEENAPSEMTTTTLHLGSWLPPAWLASPLSQLSRADPLHCHLPGTETAKHFGVRSFMADMACPSRRWFSVVKGLAGVPPTHCRSSSTPFTTSAATWNLPTLPRSGCSLLNFGPKNFDGNEALCKVIACNLVVFAREMRMCGIRPDFPAEVSLLEEAVRGLYEVPGLKAAQAGWCLGNLRAGFVQNGSNFRFSCGGSLPDGLTLPVNPELGRAIWVS